MVDLNGAPDMGAHGEARLRLYLDGHTGAVTLVAAASWFTEDGQAQESSLTLPGDIEDTWQLMSEATTWIWKRWKRPVAQASLPFGP